MDFCLLAEHRAWQPFPSGSSALGRSLPGPSLSPPEEGVPGEAVKGKEDQPSQVRL